VSALDVADVSFASPPYAAVIEWVPEVSAEVEKVPTPEIIDAVPIDAPLSLNWTVPVAVDGVTVAVNVTAWPAVEGFALDVTSTEDAAFTTSVIAGEVDAGRLISPEYCAVRE
jgi:hypothetical protein